MALIKNKLEEKQMLNRVELHEITDGTVLEFDQLNVEFFRTTHSIPDVFGVAVHTPVGTIVETGDFKFDLTPTTKQPPNLWSMARLGEKGVLLMMSDSTNAERPEWTNLKLGLQNLLIAYLTSWNMVALYLQLFF